MMRPVRQTFTLKQFPHAIRCDVLKSRGLNSLFHFHPEVEIVQIITGRLSWIVGDDMGAFEPGSLLMFGPDLPHLVHNESTQKDKACIHLIQFRREIFGEDFLALPELQQVRAVLDRAIRGLYFSPSEALKAGREINRMIKAAPTMRASGLLALLERLGHCESVRPMASPGYMSTFRPGVSERFDRACAVVMERYGDQSLTQARVSRAVGMSTSAFSRLFAKHASKPFSRFLNEVRIGQACRKLQESDASIAEISFACGFANLSNFNRRFRQHKGVTPREFRKSVRVA